MYVPIPNNTKSETRNKFDCHFSRPCWRGKTSSGWSPREKNGKMRPCDETCSICCESMDSESKIVSLACNHRFHSNCISKWMKSGNRSCPYCRQVHPIPPQLSQISIETCPSCFQDEEIVWFAGVNMFRTMYVFCMKEGEMSMSSDLSLFEAFVPRSCVCTSSPQGYIKLKTGIPIHVTHTFKVSAPSFPHAGEGSTTFRGVAEKSVEESISSLLMFSSLGRDDA